MQNAEKPIPSATGVCLEQPIGAENGAGQGATGPMDLVERVQAQCADSLRSHSAALRTLFLGALCALFHLYLALALAHDPSRASPLLAGTLLCWLYALQTRILVPFVGRQNLFVRLKKRCAGCFESFESWSASPAVKRCFCGFSVGLLLAYVVWDAREDLQRLSGLFGFGVFFVLMCFFSHKPTKVNWRPVLWGFLLQFAFGILCLKWEWGSGQFVRLSSLTTTFLGFTKTGTDFAYGFLSSPPNICGMEPVFAFQVLQVIIYIGAIVSLLYFYGVVQALLRRMALLMQFTLGTNATESLNACACVFLGNLESPLLIRPYIEVMTASELHAIMTTGMSCIAGSIFAAFISLGACPTYLLSGAAMSVPGSLACSKLLYPETERSSLGDVKELALPPSKESNAVESIANGSTASVRIVTAVVANLVAFMGVMALLNSVVGYAGTLLGFDHWSLELFLGYAFFPAAYLIGVTENAQQTLLVGRLIGVKVVVNDFVAFQHLSEMLKRDLLTPRTAMIATYALCSFSDLVGAAIQMAVLSGMAPSKRHMISKLVLRTMLAGLVSCLVTASIAGILVKDPIVCRPHVASANCFDLNAHQEFMDRIVSANASLVFTRDEL